MKRDWKEIAMIVGMFVCTCAQTILTVWLMFEAWP